MFDDTLHFLANHLEAPDWARLGEHLPYQWVEQAVVSTEAASIRHRRLPAEQVVWLMVALALYRHKSISEVLDELLPEAFATVREACRRLRGSTVKVTGHELTWDMVPYDVQLIGGIQLHLGRIAEMATGEGKTLVATLPLYLNALPGRGTHLVTVNNYLARRDSQWMGHLYRWLGLTVGCLDDTEPGSPERQAVYGCDITYGTNNEFGFDYLRDNMVVSSGQRVQRQHVFALIDEVDSILIDEARTPLIISGPVGNESDGQYAEFNSAVERLVRRQADLVNGLVGEGERQLEGGDQAAAGVSFYKAQLAAGTVLPKSGTVFLSLADRDKAGGLIVARRLRELGLGIAATRGTADHLARFGHRVDRTVAKVSERGATADDAVDLIARGEVAFVINTPQGRGAQTDGEAIRRAANVHRVPSVTTLRAALALVQGYAERGDEPVEVVALQDYHAR